jgi:hypothetical protein
MKITLGPTGMKTAAHRPRCARLPMWALDAGAVFYWKEI